jgi:hypothetical protein
MFGLYLYFLRNVFLLIPLYPGNKVATLFLDLYFLAANAHEFSLWICSVFAQVRLSLNLLLVIGSCHSVNDPQPLWCSTSCLFWWKLFSSVSGGGASASLAIHRLKFIAQVYPPQFTSYLHHGTAQTPQKKGKLTRSASTAAAAKKAKCTAAAVAPNTASAAAATAATATASAAAPAAQRNRKVARSVAAADAADVAVAGVATYPDSATAATAAAAPAGAAAPAASATITVAAPPGNKRNRRGKKSAAAAVTTEVASTEAATGPDSTLDANTATTVTPATPAAATTAATVETTALKTKRSRVTKSAAAATANEASATGVVSAPDSAGTAAVAEAAEDAAAPAAAAAAPTSKSKRKVTKSAAATVATEAPPTGTGTAPDSAAATAALSNVSAGTVAAGGHRTRRSSRIVQETKVDSQSRYVLYKFVWFCLYTNCRWLIRMLFPTHMNSYFEFISSHKFKNYKFAYWTCTPTWINTNSYWFCMVWIQWLNLGDVTLQIHSLSSLPEEASGNKVPDADADKDFLSSDNSVFTFAGEGDHVLSPSSIPAPNYHPPLEGMSKFCLHLRFLKLPLSMLIFHVIFF